MKKLKYTFTAIICLLFLFAGTAKAENVTEALGESNYLLAVNTVHGDAYVNSYQRTYNPSTNRWGTKTGVMANGDAVINLDAWTIADILGENYHVLAYTPERGNCYVNGKNETYTPGSNQVGRVTGRTPDGLPIISVIGTVMPVTQTVITRTTYVNAPATQPQEQSGGSSVYIYPSGEKYHSYPHNGDNYSRVSLEEAKRRGYTSCDVCW